ncbi:hypothetical protein JTB14_013327 [Gonioctena quinquepunctata]|nr:hypothetical protein JTB14_013327 [Gonioctena quinquepunctata]
MKALVCDLGGGRTGPRLGGRESVLRKWSGGSGLRPWVGIPNHTEEEENPDFGLGMGTPAPVGEFGDLFLVRGVVGEFQHAKAASYNISRRFANELLDVALIWITGPGRMNGWDNIAGMYKQDERNLQNMSNKMDDLLTNIKEKDKEIQERELEQVTREEEMRNEIAKPQQDNQEI